MIFNIPIKQTFISTTVPYEVPIYDENATYQDGEEVRKDDDIYTVENKIRKDYYPDFQDYKYYGNGSKVKKGGSGYEKVRTTKFAGCWETFDTPSPTPYIPDEIYFPYWDGLTFGVPYSTPTGESPSDSCKYNMTFTFYDEGIVGNHRNVRIKIDDDNGSSTVTTNKYFKLYSEIFPDPDGCFVIKNGAVSRLIGCDETTLVSSRLQDGYWVKLPYNEGKINYHELTYLRPSVRKIPFDYKQYTTVSALNSQTWKIQCDFYCDSIALGNVVADNVNIKFKSSSGYVLEEINHTLADNRLTSGGLGTSPVSEDVVEPSTVIIYVSYVYVNPIIEITISNVESGNTTKLGMIMPCRRLDVGATNLIFNHTIKNYDKNFVSPVSGYVEHIKGNRVLQHKGSFDIPLQEYDKTVLINKKITQELIAIDGSDTTLNEGNDSLTKFSSTKIIGRVKSLTTATTTKNKNQIDEYLKVNFEFEEIV